LSLSLSLSFGFFVLVDTPRHSCWALALPALRCAGYEKESSATVLPAVSTLFFTVRCFANMAITGQPVDDLAELVREVTGTLRAHVGHAGVVGACAWTIRNLSGHEALCAVLPPLLPSLLDALSRHGHVHDVLDEVLAALGNMVRRHVIPGEGTRVLLGLLAFIAAGHCTLDALQRVAWCVQCVVEAGPSPVDVDVLTPPLLQALAVHPPHGASLCCLLALLHVLVDSMFDVEGLAAAVVDACYRFRHGRRGNDGMEEREIMAEALPLVLAGLRQREVRLPSPNPRST
jgi:hypothetical protein